MSSFLFLLMLVAEWKWTSSVRIQLVIELDARSIWPMLTLIAATGARMPRCKNNGYHVLRFLCEISAATR